MSTRDPTAAELDRELDPDVLLVVPVLADQGLEDLLTDVLLGGVLTQGGAVDEVEHLPRWDDGQATVGSINL